jgi:hypothetical protein
VISIAIPILLVELLFPARREERWVGRRGMIGLSLLLLFDVALGFFLLTPYRPPAIPYLLSVVAVVVLFFVAKRLSSPDDRGESTVPQESTAALPRRPVWFGLTGFFATLAFFFTNWVLPENGLPVLLTMLTTLFLVVGVAWVTHRMSRGAWTDIHRLALASGALMFFALLAPLQEIDTSRTDNTTGMAVVGLAALFFLIWLRRRVRRNNLVMVESPA